MTAPALPGQEAGEQGARRPPLTEQVRRRKAA